MVLAIVASVYPTLMNVTNWSLRGRIASTPAIIAIAVGMNLIQ